MVLLTETDGATKDTVRGFGALSIPLTKKSLRIWIVMSWKQGRCFKCVQNWRKGATF